MNKLLHLLRRGSLSIFGHEDKVEDHICHAERSRLGIKMEVLPNFKLIRSWLGGGGVYSDKG